jgi:hypothetical protein
MNKEIKQRWCKALKAGNYIQTSGTYLADNSGYDALGLLCDLYILDTDNNFWLYNMITHRYELDGQDNVLPLAVADWAGIPQTPLIDRFVVPVIWEGKMTNIAKLNDSGMTFKQLADIIEQKL